MLLKKTGKDITGTSGRGPGYYGHLNDFDRGVIDMIAGAVGVVYWYGDDEIIVVEP